MLGGFLGGLANLGTAYSGYLGAQSQYLQNQLQQQRLQDLLQQQQAAQATWSDLSGGGLNKLLGGGMLPTTQPGTATPGATPTPSPLQPLTPANLLPASYQQPTAPTQPLPQVPSYAGALDTSPPNLTGLGGGTPSTYGMGGPASSFGPGQPSTGTAGGAGTGLPLGGLAAGLPPQTGQLPGDPFASRGIPNLYGPLENAPGPAAPQQRDQYALRGPAAGADVYSGALSLDQPTLNGYGLGGQAPQPPSAPTQPSALDFGPQIAALRAPTIQGPTRPQGPAPQIADTAIAAQRPDIADTRYAPGGTAAVPETRDTGGAPQVGGAETGPVASQIANVLRQRGWSDAAIKGALANGMAESSLQPWGATGAAGEQGIWQMNPSGELPGYQRLYGGSKSIEDQTNYMASRVEATMPGYTKLASATQATDAFMIGFERPARAVPGLRYQFLGQSDRGDAVTNAMATSRAMVAQSTSPQEKQATSIGNMQILQRYPFLAQQLGTFDIDGLAKLIEHNHPDASPGVKVGIFNNLFNLLHPIAKEKYAETIDLVKADIAEQQRAETQRETARFHAAEERHWAATEGGGGTIVQAGPPDNPQFFRIPTRGGPAQPVEGLPGPVTRLPTAGAGSTAGGVLKDELYEYTDKEGNPHQITLRPKKGMAGYTIAAGPDQGKDFKLPEGVDPESFRHISASTFGGGRAQAQVGRQLTGGAEVAVDLGNVAEMPVGTTIGPLGTVEPGVSLTGAIKGDLARTLTSEDEINMKQAMSGIGRELSTLMNPVYGGKWSSDQLEPLIPKTGYSVGNSLYGIARIRQSAENALQSAIKSPLLSKEQKDYARQLQQQMAEAIPWTVADVQRWIRQGDPQESFGDFVRRERISGGAKGREGGAAPAATETPSTAQPQAAPSAQPSAGRTAPTAPADRMNVTDIPGASLNDPDGTRYANPVSGETWIKQGSQAVKAQ